MLLPFKGIAYETTHLFHGQAPVDHARKMPCADIELNTVECLEAYGLIKGRERCAKYLEDLMECKYSKLRKARWYAMRAERIRKVASGEIPWEKRYGNPFPYQSYVIGTYMP